MQNLFGERSNITRVAPIFSFISFVKFATLLILTVYIINFKKLMTFVRNSKLFISATNR